MSNSKENQTSRLLQAVQILDGHFQELVRLGKKIEQSEFHSDSEIEQTQKLMNVFAQTAQGVADGVVNMSQALNIARMKAEEAAQSVAARAEKLQLIQAERQKKMDAFRILGEKVQALNASLIDLKKPEGSHTTDEDRAKLSMRLSEFEIQLHPLIQEAQALKLEAQNSKMTFLEQNVHALKQSLEAVSKKLGTFQQADEAHPQ